MINQQDIKDIQELYRRSFAIELTSEQALEKLHALVGMMRNVWKPMTQEQLDQLQERRRQTGDLL